jgi:hypothetical protein
MSETQTPNAPPPQTIEELTAEIEQTREDLGQTVQALADKANVKAHARQKVAAGKQAVGRQAGEIKQRAAGMARSGRSAATRGARQVRQRTGVRTGAAAAGGLAVALALLVWWRRR